MNKVISLPYLLNKEPLRELINNREYEEISGRDYFTPEIILKFVHQDGTVVRNFQLLRVRTHRIWMIPIRGWADDGKPVINVLADPDDYTLGSYWVNSVKPIFRNNRSYLEIEAFSSLDD